MFFELDFTAFLLVVLFILALIPLWRWRRAFFDPVLFYPHLQDLQPPQYTSWRAKLAFLPRLLKFASLGLFLLAFIDPHLQIEKFTADTVPKEGIAVYIVADRSGSMAQKVRVLSPTERWITIPKIDLLKQITEEFIRGNSRLGLAGRANDLIGLAAFARTTQVLVPLTLDHKDVLSQLDKLHVVTNQDEDGTAIGYALYKTVNLIDATRHYAQDLVGTDLPAYDIKNAVIILVTDGFHAPNPLDQGHHFRSIDLISAANYAKEKNVRIYLVTMEPALASEEFGPHRRLMQKVAELTGGKYYLISDGMGLGKIYADIDSLEKSTLPPLSGLSRDEQPHRYLRVSFYPYLIALGAICLGTALLLYTTWLRRVP